MAQIFLSYDREDAEKARQIALTLEKAGHSVWWDQHIRGGAQYSQEIDKALKQSDAVVVLWSDRSVQSAWVRDEAAAGRDSGRLVPIMLDEAEPPLGFRQYQAINLSRAKLRTGSRQFGQLLSAVDALGSAPAGPPPAQAHGQPKWQHRSQSLAAGITLVVAAISGLLVWRPWVTSRAVPSVTVAPSDPNAKSLADNLLVQLGSLQSSRADALQLVEPGSDRAPDLIFRVGGVAGAADPRATLALVDGRADTLLWSHEFVQPGGNQADLRQQLAYSAAQVLRCATEALAPGHPPIKLPTLRLYLNGCAVLSTTMTDPRTTIPMFQRVTEQAPRFPGGWGKLIIAELEAFKRSWSKALQAQLKSDIQKARNVDPALAEIYLAQSWLQPPRPILGWMHFAEEALAKNPDHAETLENRSIGMLHVGRMGDAVSDARRAVEVEPLSSKARRALIFAMMDAGEFDAARKVLLDAERLWPGATNLLQARYTLEFHYGDPKKAIGLLHSGQLGFTPPVAHRAFLEARTTPSSANVDRAIAEARSSFSKTGDLQFFVHALATFGRIEDLADVLLTTDPNANPGAIIVFFRPPFARLHRDIRFMEIAERFGLSDYWRKSGKWPDFCFEPDLPYDCKKEAAKLTGSKA